ncbi:glycosyltransferase family 2 protein [Leeuwenhoekiella sp. W20_SRS_FM14]|uniref:glycosyltransferase family 2 protein n=1 Tax=Leeuwenhoekiella sp. W20_SRS_FM14 TaxID=3240270 RepID=UPI003F964904
MKLSVIILNYKVPYFLQLCLQSVTRALLDINSEIIVVDNASEDSSVKMVQQYFPEVKIIANTTNSGFSKANNQGVAQAKGEYICILNPDTVISENCFSTLLKFSQNQSNMGAVGIRLIDGTGNYLPESKRNLPTIKVSALKIIGNTSAYYANQLAQDEVGKVPVLVGAFMFIKRQVFLDAGGFDEDYFMYGEDIDLSYTLHKKGYTNFYYGKLTAIHFKGESSSKDKIYAQRFFGAMHIFHKKHFSKGLISSWFLAFFLKILSFSYSLPRSKKKIIPPISNFYLVCEDVKSVDTMRLNLEKELKVISLAQVKLALVSNALIVFNLKSLSTTAIISAMTLLKNNQNRFRIRPSNCNFIAGSDSSTDRGEIQIW